MMRMMWRAIRHATVVTLLVAFVASCSSQIRPASCLKALMGNWSIRATSADSGVIITGSIKFDSTGGEMNVVSETGEGLREPLNYPVGLLKTVGDSIAFTFAPAGFVFRGHCVQPDGLRGQFVVPNPPFDSIRGTWWAQWEGREERD